MIRLVAVEIERGQDMSRRQAEEEAVKRCLEALGFDTQLCHSADGAPFLKNRPDMRISISHSAQWAVVAVAPADRGLMGIDIEDSSRPQLVKVASRYLSAEEVILAQKTPDGFAKAWTAKEAVFKAVTGKAVSFTSHIRIDDSFSRAIFIPHSTSLSLNYINFRHSNILCIASQGNNFEIITL